MAFHRYCFLGVIGINVLKDFILREWSSIFRISCQPESWGLGIEVVGDAKVIFSCLYNFDLASLGLFLLSSWLGEHVVVAITEVIEIEYLIILFPSPRIHNLYLLTSHFFIIIDIKYLLLLLIILFLRILGLHPAIFQIHLQFTGIVGMELLELLDPFFARDSLGD